MAAPDRNGFPVRPPDLGRARVSEAVSAYLRDMILSGQVRAGEPLRVEHLADQLDTSVTPIRESLVELLAEGFVEHVTRRGYAVARLARSDIEDLFTAHGLIAGELAARAAKAADRVALDAFESMQADLEDASQRKDFGAMEELNHRFHRTVNTLADARKLAWFVQRISRYAPRWTWQLIDGWPDASVSDHAPILAAFRAGDGQAARLAMDRHIRRSGLLLADHLEASGFYDEPSARAARAGRADLSR